MKFIHTDLGHQRGGEIVEVTLRGSAANVRLLDATNFERFRRGGKHDYRGGLARSSPVRMSIPRAGRWHVVVDMQGLRGTTRASVRVIPKTAFESLPPLREPRSDLAEIARNLSATEPQAERDFDLFISHASEDKESIVRPLAHALEGHGLGVWYDEFELRVGDSLRRKIDQGIARSRFGVVVLSRSFFRKGWTQYELDGLVSMAVSGAQVLLPLWHEVSKDDVMRYSPSLVDKVALRTSDYTVEEIAAELAAVVVDGRA